MSKPKSKGAGIMVSDFIDEHNGSPMMNTRGQQKSIPPRSNMHVHSSSMVRTVKDTGIGTDLLIR